MTAGRRFRVCYDHGPDLVVDHIASDLKTLISMIEAARGLETVRAIFDATNEPNTCQEYGKTHIWIPTAWRIQQAGLSEKLREVTEVMCDRCLLRKEIPRNLKRPGT